MSPRQPDERAGAGPAFSRRLLLAGTQGLEARRLVGEPIDLAGGEAVRPAVVAAGQDAIQLLGRPVVGLEEALEAAEAYETRITEIAARSAARRDPDAPWPVRAGSPALLWLYSNSLGLALGALFLASFALHWVHSARHAAELAAMHGRPAPTLLEHLAGAQLWFESFQNWQSEFLSTFALVVLGIFLRQRGSPESKPVAAPHDSTGH